MHSILSTPNYLPQTLYAIRWNVQEMSCWLMKCPTTKNGMQSEKYWKFRHNLLQLYGQGGRFHSLKKVWNFIAIEMTCPIDKCPCPNYALYRYSSSHTYTSDRCRRNQKKINVLTKKSSVIYIFFKSAFYSFIGLPLCASPFFFHPNYIAFLALPGNMGNTVEGN